MKTTVRLTNPVLTGNKYTVDVEFKCDTLDQQLFGMNVRFFYDSTIFTKALQFKDFKGGYKKYSPNPPFISTGNYASRQLFGFAGGATYVNGAIILDNHSHQPILLNDWQKLFSIEFTCLNITTNLNLPIVLDLESDTTKGGFLPGSDGIVITMVGGKESVPCNEQVEQYNWEYIGSGNIPYGRPV